MRLFKNLLRGKSQPKGQEFCSHSDNVGSTSMTQQGPSLDGSFPSLVTRSIAAWQALALLTLEEKTTEIPRIASTLGRLNTLDDLLRSEVKFWFFQRRESFMKQKGFIKWDPSRLDEYILLPIQEGFVTKRDCFYVSHYWRTKEHPDPRGEDFALVRQDMSREDWEYIWVDWTCLPPSPRSQAEEKYATKMLRHSGILMRSCMLEWRYPSCQPRLWILVETAQSMLSSTGNKITHDSRPFVNDMNRMMTEGVRQVIYKRSYNCSVKRDYQLLVWWLELLVILTKLVEDLGQRRDILDLVDDLNTTDFRCHDTGIHVDKINGIVSQGRRVFRFIPMWPLFEDSLPELFEDPSQCRPPPCVDRIVETLQDPELSKAKARLDEAEQSLGEYDRESISCMNELANNFARLGQHRETEEMRYRALYWVRKTRGSWHPDTKQAVRELAAVAETKLSHWLMADIEEELREYQRYEIE